MQGKIFRKLGIKYSYLLIPGVIASFIMTQSLVMGTNIISCAIDELSGKNEFAIASILQSIIVIIMIGTVAAYLRLIFMGKYGISITKNFNELAIDKLLKLEYKIFDEEGTGSIITKLVSDAKEVEKYFASTVPDLIVSVISIGIVLLYILQLNLVLTLITTIIYPVVLIVTFFLGKKLKIIAQKRRGKIDEMISVANDCIEGITVVRSFNLLEVVKIRLNKSIQAILENEYVRAWIMHTSQTLQRLLFWIPNMVCPVVALNLVLDGKLTIGGMTAYIVLMNKIINNMRELPFLINDAKEKVVSLERLEVIINAPEETSGPDDMYITDLLNNCLNVLKMSNIQFTYNSDGNQVYDDLNLDILKGKTTAVVGPSGQGKSTIFKLLCGFYKQSNGELLIFGKSFERWNLSMIRKQIAIVNQRPFIFAGTIAENIAFGKENTNMDEIIEAAKRANIHDFIMSLPSGYETDAGANGAKLSGGEKQRISIARAIIKDAPILLMDEPTSSVDVQTEQLIQNSIEELAKDKTIIIIAHRLSTIMNADNIIVVDKGRVIEKGTHEELLRQTGKYSELYSYELQKEGANYNASKTCQQ